MIFKYQKKIKIFIYVALFLITSLILFASVDIYWDFVNDSSWQHILVEAGFLFFLVFFALVGLIIYFKITKTTLGQVINDMQDMQDTQRRLTEGIARHIHSQFTDWKLTETESDIAYLIIKGYSTNEIATLRSSAESTIKEHASNIYRKAGVNGRTQLTSFFLEDLLPPPNI